MNWEYSLEKRNAYKDFDLYRLQTANNMQILDFLDSNIESKFFFSDREGTCYLGLGEIPIPNFFESYEALSDPLFFFYLNNFEKTKKNIWLPQIQITQNPQGISAYFLCAQNQHPSEILNWNLKKLDFKKPIFLEYKPNFSEFSKIFQSAKNELKKSLQKIVLSRKAIFKVNNNFSTAFLFKNLYQTGFYNYFYQKKSNTLLGSSPERLLKFKDGQFFTEALAGTRKIEKKDELLLSKKDQEEQQIVVQEIKKRLSPLSSHIYISPPMLLEFKNMAHLRSEIQCKPLTTNLFDWLDQLHPTSAVCGLPRTEAYDFLQRHEPYERDSYASTFGILKKNQMDITVCIRGCYIINDLLTATTGVGVVPESQLELEWQELDIKLQPLLRALNIEI